MALSVFVLEPPIVRTLGSAAVPAEADALGVNPGEIVISQDEPGARLAPQVDDLVVPVGRAGLGEVLIFNAGFCPVFVITKIRDVPPAYRANVDALKDKEVVLGGLSVQLMEIEVTFAVTLAPEAFESVQVCVLG